MQNLLLFLMLNTSPAIHTDSLLFTNSRIKESKGQGTGLGLSLAYDIVKAHGGELKVETNSVFTDIEGFTKGTKFTVMLPA